MPDHAASWRIAPDRTLSLDAARLMGILNVTPDSFSDGGAYATVEAQLARAREMIEAGASIIDVGGESTRPGAQRVDVRTQIDRTCPLIEALSRASDVVISIDTTRAEVAAAALDAGAHAINDVAAGNEDAGMLGLAAARSCGIVLMHRRVPPDRDSYSDAYAEPPAYDDVVAEVARFLRDRATAAEAAGVARAAIVLDPGLGFGKTVEQTFTLIARTAELVTLGYPVLGAASRKSFIGAASGVTEPSRRVAGSVAASLAQHRGGVRLFRVHDVRAHREAFGVQGAIDGAGG